MKGSRSINDLSSFGDRETPVPSSSNKTLPRQRKGKISILFCKKVLL